MLRESAGDSLSLCPSPCVLSYSVSQTNKIEQLKERTRERKKRIMELCLISYSRVPSLFVGDDCILEKELVRSRVGFTMVLLELAHRR